MISMEMFGSGFQIITVTYITTKLWMEWLIRKVRQAPVAAQNVVNAVDITEAKKRIFVPLKEIQAVRQHILQLPVSGSVQIHDFLTTQTTMRGFLLITVMVLTLLIGGVMLSFFQQSIQQRFQSRAFLESQILFQELSGAAVQAQNYLLNFTPNQLQQNPPVLGNSMFAEGFKDWSGTVKVSASDLLVTLHVPNDSGGADFQLLLRNADNTSGIEYLKPDGVLILEN